MGFARFVNVIFVPLLVIIAGIFISLRRRSKSLSPASSNRAIETGKEEQDGV
jgi:hypothetical protein